MKNIFKNRFVKLLSFVITALFLRFYLEHFIEEPNSILIRMASIIIILGFGGFFVLKGVAEIIEETTEILSERTKIASGLLQSLGTAFPDMVLGIVAAIISLSLVKEDYALAINFAIIAAATTFGSNIYNIAHAVWCVFRQNLANKKEKNVLMLPGTKAFGIVIPMKDHQSKPSLKEIDSSVDILNVLTILTAVVAITMVIFGKVQNPPENMQGDLYQLIKPVGGVILALCIIAMYSFRKTKRSHIVGKQAEKDERYYSKKSTWVILMILLASGISILFTAESMVKSVQSFCEITGMPFVIAGVLAGIIG